MTLTLTKPALEASVCRDSFYDFLCRFWETIISEPFVPNWHIEFLCGEIQRSAERVIKREKTQGDILINISPGTTKSTLCSVMLPVWLWTRDPSIRVITGSYASSLSTALARLSRNIILSDKYRALFPSVELVTEGVEEMITSRGGSRVCTSVGGAITGKHAHIIIVDDPISPLEAVSQTALKRATEWMDQTLSTRKVDWNITTMIVIMQRLHQADPSGHLLTKKGRLQHICLPAEVTSKVSPKSVLGFYKDGLMDPIRLSREKLKSVREALGEYGYAGQFLQSPVPLSGGMFKTDKLNIQTVVIEQAQVVRYWDKAGTEGGSGAYTVGCKMGIDKYGKFWVLDIVRGRWEAGERERVIQQTAALDGRGVVIGIEQEPGSGGKESADSSLRRLAGYRVRLDRPTGDKALRADTYAVQVNSGNVTMRRAEWNKDYLEELSYFPFSRYKDQCDASSGAFGMLTKPKLKVGGLW